MMEMFVMDDCRMAANDVVINNEVLRLVINLDRSPKRLESISKQLADQSLSFERFPAVDGHKLTKEELSRSQFVTLNKGRGNNFKYMPFAFTELGVAMLSSVLNSDIAIEINRNIMRAFVAIRNYTLQATTSSIEIKELQERIKSLEMANEETLCAINDLSEDTQKSLDNIYIALSELATKKKNNAKRPKIGYIK